MSPERWKRVESIFQEALEKAASERGAFLDRSCGDDVQLREAVEEALAAFESGGSQLGHAVGRAAAEMVRGIDREEISSNTSAIGLRIGAYRVIGELGRGGMGAVYRAQRDDRQFSKDVAIKLIGTGVVSPTWRARFREEQQILATLEHPNIARLLDGGVTDDGLQYIIMECIDGEPIDAYCDRNALKIEERLKLFQGVCSAVHYAHQHFVVHRDIKPGNILVTTGSSGRPIAKLLDFGIAKVVDPAVDSTLTMAPAMTPDYASPEQLRGGAITTASDVYSLGVLLYGLLSGAKPYRLTGRPLSEVLHIVCEQDPPRPSVAAARQELTGDLDAIVLKAMRKEPQERYASTEELSSDIGRYLSMRPVLARRGSYRYVARKFVARHKFGMAASFGAAALLIGGLTAVAMEYRVVKAERAKAERRFNDVRKLAGSVVSELYDGIAALPGSTAVRKLLVTRALEYLDSLAKEAEGDASLQMELAAAYARVGDVQEIANTGDTAGALASFEKARTILQAVLVSKPGMMDARIQMAKVYGNISWSYFTLRNYSMGAESGRESLARWEAIAQGAPEERETRRGVGRAHYLIGKSLLVASPLGDPLPEFEKALEIHGRLLAESPEDVNDQRNVGLDEKQLCSVFEFKQDFNKAAEHCRVAVELDEKRAAGTEDPQAKLDLAYSLSQSGTIYEMKGDLPGAERSFRRSVEIRKALAAADPRDQLVRDSLFYPGWSLARILDKRGRHTEAMEHYREIIELGELLIKGDQAPTSTRGYLAEALLELGDLSERMGRKDAACSYYRQSLQRFQELANRGVALHDDEREAAKSVDQRVKTCRAEAAHR